MIMIIIVLISCVYYYYYFLFNVLFGPLIGSTKTELPMYKKKKNLQGPNGGGKKKRVFSHSPSLAKPHEDKPSQLTNKKEDGRDPFWYAAA